MCGGWYSCGHPGHVPELSSLPVLKHQGLLFETGRFDPRHLPAGWRTGSLRGMRATLEPTEPARRGLEQNSNEIRDPGPGLGSPSTLWIITGGSETGER